MNNNNKQQSLADGSITAGYLASRPMSGSGPDGSIKRGEARRRAWRRAKLRWAAAGFIVGLCVFVYVTLTGTATGLLFYLLFTLALPPACASAV